MTSLVIERISLVVEEVERGIEAVKQLLERLKEDSTATFSEEEEITVCILEQDTVRLEKEISKLLSLEPDPELTEKLPGYSKLQFSAEHLLTDFKYRQHKRTEPKVPLQAGQSSVHTRLPKFDLPKFYGDVLQWDEFWDQFCSSVHNRDDLEDVDRLKYLQNSLEGDAKKVIEGLKTTSSNYSIAVTRLKNRYGKPGRQIDAHYNALYQIPKAGNVTSDCRRVLDTIERHLSVLQSMGEDRNQKSLRPVLLDKFPAEIRHDLRLLTTGDDHTLDEICSFLDKVITAREDASDSVPTPQPGPNFTTEALFAGPEDKPKNSQIHRSAKPNRNKHFDRDPRRGDQSGRKRAHSQHGRQQRKPQGSAYSTSYEPPTKTPRLRCVFCRGNHYSDTCSVIESITKRREWISNRKLCFVCLSSKHKASSCPDKRKCYHCKESGRHNRCLCPNLELPATKEEQTNSMVTCSRIGTILQTALVTITNAGWKFPCRILFDTGSEKSYILSNVAKQLRLKHIEEAALTIYTFGSKVPIKQDAAVVSFLVPTMDQPVEVQAYVVPTTTGNIPAYKLEKEQLRKAYSNLNIALDVDNDQPADIVIGNDFYYFFMLGEVKRLASGPYLLKSRLGWIVSGSLPKQQTFNHQLSVLTFVQGSITGNTEFHPPDPSLRDDNIRDIWELETIGIRDSPKVVQEEEAIRYFNETTKFIDGRYYVKWPWAQYPPELPINFGLALGRLRSLVKRLDSSLLQAYDAVIREQLDKGIIEEIHEEHLPRTHPVHYLPHQSVVQEQRTTKVRIVYDASAKSKGQLSLNDLLYKGPLMLEDLLSLLLRFRTHQIGLIADIEKAFLQVSLQNEDRDVTRFLWLRDINKPPSDENLLQLRFCRVPFGIISSPFLLAAIINYHLRKKGTPLALQMSRSLYVDNLVTGTHSHQEAVSLYKEARANFGELSMNIREWSSNDQAFISNVPEAQRKVDKSVPVLGMRWNTTHDQLSLSVTSSAINQNVVTKRQALKVIASVYDPCGLTAPLTLPARLFLQSLWVIKMKWDDALTAHQQEMWETCVQSLNVIPTVCIPRYYFHPFGKPDAVELHCFTDSSDDCYCAAVYIRAIFAKNVSVTLVISKSRLTPVKNRENMTTPKLELLAVLIGTRLISYVQRNLDMTWGGTFLWTDSQIVLGWLKSQRLLPPFVARRVDEIRKSVHVQFRYVPTHINPADVATRPLRCNSLMDRWLKGPDFLYRDTASWPSPLEDQFDLLEPQQGLKGPPQQAQPSTSEQHSATYLVSEKEQYELPEQGIALSSHILRRLQRSHYPVEAAGDKTDLSSSLGLFQDEQGVLRCRGRYQNASLSYDQKNPILLPPNSDVTLEIIRRIHEGNCHVGVTHTLSLLRNYYWVPKGRSTVIKVLKACKTCLKFGGGPYKMPEMPSLPKERVEYSPPFTFTGLDYLGPLTVIENGKPQKRWCCLFTCMSVRAIHLEVVSDLTAAEFMLGLKRFVATRGTPSLIISDNAAQFKLSASLLSSVEVQGKTVAWRFIPELSPWQGGFYERLVGLVKHCLYRTIDRSLLSDRQLCTVLKEIEAVLNTRPLTTVGSEPEVVLTPAHFLSTTGITLVEPPPATMVTSKTGVEVIHMWKRLSNLRREFAKMFVNQYLLSLRDRLSFRHKQPRIVSERVPQVGDVVQLKGDSKNRSLWKVGKISGLLASSDGAVRTAQVTLLSGQVLNRSIGLLYPLELAIKDSDGSTPTDPVEPFAASSAPASSVARPPRASPHTPLPRSPLSSTPPAVVSSMGDPATSGDVTPAASRCGPRKAALQARDRIRLWSSCQFAAAVRCLGPPHE